MRSHHKIELFITILLGVVSMYAQSVHAAPAPKTTTAVQQVVPPVVTAGNPAGPINLTLSPSFVNLYTDPGKEVSSQFVITNNNSFAEHYKLSLVKYQVSGGGSSISISDVSSSDPYTQWMNLPEGQIDVDANQSKTIKFSITPPKDATLGYYYGIMVSRVNEDLPKDKTAVRAAPVFSVILEVNTPGAKRELQLVDFSTESMIYEYLPAVFNVTLKNTGNIHIVPTGNVFIDWGDQKDIGILRANPGRANVLPQATREFTSSWDDGFAVRVPKRTANGALLRDKNGHVEMTTSYDLTKFHKFRIGRYTAHLLMVYDNGQRDVPLEARLSFWVLPWKILGALGLVAIFAILGIRSMLVSVIKKVR